MPGLRPPRDAGLRSGLRIRRRSGAADTDSISGDGERGGSAEQRGAAIFGCSAAAVDALRRIVRPFQLWPRSPPSCGTGPNRLSGRPNTGRSVFCDSNSVRSMYASVTRGASDDRLRSRPLPPTMRSRTGRSAAARMAFGHELRVVNRRHRLRFDADVRARLVEKRRVDARRLDQRDRDRRALPPPAPSAARR